MSNLFKKSYRNFLLKSNSAHGIHSPFVYDLVTLCLRKKRKTLDLYKDLSEGFPNIFKPKHISILNDVISYLEVSKYGHFCESEHGIDKLPITKLLEKTEHRKADLIYIPQENFNLHHSDQLVNELKKESVLVIENPYSNVDAWDALKNHPKTHVVVDTYFFGFIFNRKQQAKEQFNIRI